MYDIIVVGGGHAGCEAAIASAKMGFKTLLATGNLNMVGSMPCNPSIGGPAKGVVVREIDALGGYMGKNADLCQIQTKMLNKSKGPAVWALRFQEDKILYSKEMLKYLKTVNNLELLESYVIDLVINGDKIEGVVLENGIKIAAKAVVLTTGTYLDSRILRGHWTSKEGPDGQKTTAGISGALRRCGFTIQRLKTGTPARIKASTIDFSKATMEPGDDITWHFSFDKGYESITGKRVPCYLTYTNLEIHKLIMDNLEKSAMYGGIVEGIGPRYCPSIEDKVVRFSDKERHQIFYEPESLELDQEYIQGFSTSMPVEVQDKMLRLLPGLENCEVIRYAYAIEYDAIDSKQLKQTLETKLVEGLYTAGQINGTSGYEEAACQGLMAGINASLKLEGKEPFILKRNEAYIGVLIDDLVTKGVKDPYRLLTSRAEYRLLLRHDNADLRLTDYAKKIGLINDCEYARFQTKRNQIEELTNLLQNARITPQKEINDYLIGINTSPLKDGISLYDLLKRPEITMENIKHFIDINYNQEVIEQVEINARYTGYIAKANKEALKMEKLENHKIPQDIDYNKIPNLASEARQKLDEIKPTSIGQATRISGVNPSDIAILSVYLKRKSNNG